MRGVLLPQWRAEAVEVTFGKTTDVQACGQRSVGENFNSVVGKEDALGSAVSEALERFNADYRKAVHQVAIISC